MGAGNPDPYTNAYNRFQFQEAVWLDSIVKQYIPVWVTATVLKIDQTRGTRWLGGLLHLFIDYVIITKIMKIKISRNQDTSVLTKGFRTPQQRLDQIRTTVTKNGETIATKAFKMGIIF